MDTTKELQHIKKHSSRKRVVFVSGNFNISFSSVDLMNAEWQELSLSTIKKPVAYPRRHNFSFQELIEIVDQMNSLKVCVLGDTIVDEYVTCDALGMSQEDPTIVVTPVAREKFIGGAGIVALHAQGLGADVNFFSTIGKDDTGDYVKTELESLGLNAHLFQDESRPTTLKQRFRARPRFADTRPVCDSILPSGSRNMFLRK